MFTWAILIATVVLALMGVILLFKVMDMCDDIKTIRNLMVRDAKNGHPRINAPTGQRPQ